jgi:hypothetical protein
MPLISQWEVSYIAQGIECGIRSDGRGCTDFRPLEFELSLIPQASGSSRLHLGTTDVLVGVKVRPLPGAGAGDCEPHGARCAAPALVPLRRWRLARPTPSAQTAASWR